MNRSSNLFKSKRGQVVSPIQSSIFCHWGCGVLEPERECWVKDCACDLIFLIYRNHHNTLIHHPTSALSSFSAMMNNLPDSRSRLKNQSTGKPSSQRCTDCITDTERTETQIKD